MTSRAMPRDPSTLGGFALVITLIMVVLAAVLVVALMSSALIERGTAQSVNDRYQADIAVLNGLEAAKKALAASPDANTGVTKDDTFLVLRADGNQANGSGTKDAYYFLAKAQPGASNTVDCYPLFSGGIHSTVAINLAATPAVVTPQPPTALFPNPAQDPSGNIKYPKLLPFQQPVFTGWEEVHSPNDVAVAPPYNLPYQRYAFWIEDSGGYLDASVVGNTIGPGATHVRANGTDPLEIALFTLFDATQPTDPGNTRAKDLIDNRSLLFTGATLAQIPPAAVGPDITRPNLVVRQGIDADGEQNLIPFGYGYPNAGQPKPDLNALIGSKNVTAIASAITTTLPAFSNRSGGLPTGTFDYAKNLAANFIDYADANNAPTTDGSTYRGIGAFPFIASTYDLNNWIRTDNNGGEYSAVVEVTTYVQLWNPHNVVASGAMSIHYENVDSLNVNGSTENYTPPPDLTAAVSLSPNQYKVFVFPPKTYTFDWGPTPPAANASIPFPSSTTVNTVQLTWNNRLADRTYKNVQRPLASVGMKYNGSNPNSSGNWVWRGNAAPPLYPNVGAPGDPRISYYLNRSWTDASYANNSSWGGRLILTSVPAQLQPSIWPDGGHDSTLGKKPTQSVRPDVAAGQVVLAPDDTKKWTSKLSTRGSLETLAELGNVFDPGQWSYPIPSTNASTSLPDIPNSATADDTAGGGYTLAVGRPEFSRFDSNGKRAWQLLDVFGRGIRTATRALVNLNTASLEGLRAVATGVLLDGDPAVAPGGARYSPKSSNAAREADLFAQAVVNSRPFLSTAQLQTITNAIGPFFGNPKQWQGQANEPTEWNNAGREELFSKIFNLSTVRSRNFRVFVTGQALDKNGKVLSTVSKVFQVFLKPTRNATTGAILSQQVEVRYEAFL